MPQSKVVWCCSEVQALTVRSRFVETPVDMLAVEVTNIQTGVWERRDSRWCESRAWRFVDDNNLVANHSVSDCSGDWSTSDHLNYSWTNVARPWFLLAADPASESWESLACLQLCSGSLVGRYWMPCSYRLAAQWQISSFAVRPSVFSWRMLGRGSSSAFLLQVYCRPLSNQTKIIINSII